MCFIGVYETHLHHIYWYKHAALITHQQLSICLCPWYLIWSDTRVLKCAGFANTLLQNNIKLLPIGTLQWPQSHGRWEVTLQHPEVMSAPASKVTQGCSAVSKGLIQQLPIASQCGSAVTWMGIPVLRSLGRL